MPRFCCLVKAYLTCISCFKDALSVFSYWLFRRKSFNETCDCASCTEADFTQGAEVVLPEFHVYRICLGVSPCARNIALPGCRHSTPLSSVLESAVPTHKEQACRLEQVLDAVHHLKLC